MDLPNQILLYILLIAGGQGLALAITIYSPRPRSIHTTFFSLFVLLISLGCLEKSISGLFFPVPHTGLPFPLAHPLSYYPAIYLHLCFLANPSRPFRRLDLLHFAPTLILDFLSYYYLDWPGNPTPFGIVSGIGLPLFETLYTVAFIAYVLTYAAVIHKLHEKLLARSNSRNASLIQWLNHLKPLLLVFWISWIIVKLIGKQNPVGYGTSFLFHSAAILCIYGLGYSYLLKMKELLLAERERLRLQPDFDPAPIIEKLRSSQLHRNQQVTLATAAKQLALPQKTLSQAINFVQNANFNDFINQLRIDDFKAHLQSADTQRLSLFGLAQEVGFSSKTSFHRAFKKQTAQTPGEYLATLSPKTENQVPNRDPVPLNP